MKFYLAKENKDINDSLYFLVYAKNLLDAKVQVFDDWNHSSVLGSISKESAQKFHDLTQNNKMNLSNSKVAKFITYLEVTTLESSLTKKKKIIDAKLKEIKQTLSLLDKE